MKKMVALVICICLAGVAAWWLRLPAAPVEITIPPGSTAHEVASILYRSHVISFPFVFLQAVQLSGKAKDLKAGTYFISPRSSVLAVINVITSGRVHAIKVTIPEGFTARQVADRLAAAGVAQGDKFMALVEQKKLEGYLFPETYLFKLKSTEEEIAGTMVKEFRRHFTPEMEAKAKAMHMEEGQVVTLASIIEKEAKRAEERPLISAVFHNRLKKHWYLESCATVLYALGEHKAKLTYKDLKIDSPYNTYHHLGLPPGPICNPGVDSIRAALYPATTDDMFFVAGSSGTHVFSRYFNEHLRNKKLQSKKKTPAKK